MYLLDTNVISELRHGKPRQALAVRDWAAAQPRSALYLSSITKLELEIGELRIARKDAAQAAALRAWRATVLLQFAGNKRNDPRHGDARPGLAVPRAMASVDAVWILSNANDETSSRHGDALAAALGKGRRGELRVHHRALPMGGEDAVKRLAAMQQALDAFVTALQGEMGPAFARAEFVVSLSVGTLAQRAAQHVVGQIREERQEFHRALAVPADPKA